VGDTLFAAIYPDGDENSNISFNPDQGINGTFTPRAGEANHPVIEVTWAGARRFAHFYDRRLPSEAEWEKAAKGTTAVHGDSLFQIDEVDIVVGFGTLYPWGNDVSNAHFNFINSGDPDETRVGVGTTPVGFYNGSSSSGFSTISNESPFGAFDMAGNVSEWCEEDFVDYHSGSNEHLKVIKGGSWRRGANEATGFWRQMIEPDQTDNAIGFRTVKSLSP